MKFAHLHTHSHYSLLDGLAKIDDLINRAKELKMNSLALTDHGNLYGAVEFYKKAKAAGIKPILGIEIYVAPRSRFQKEPKIDDDYFHLTLLAKNETGWKNLIKLSSKAHLEGFYYKPRADKDLFKEYSEGIIAMSGCLGGEIPQLLLKGKFEEAEKTAEEYAAIFGKENFFLEIWHHPNIPESVKVAPEIEKLSRKTGIPLVATQDIHYAQKDDAQYHDILLAVQTGNKLSDDDRLTLKADDFSMKTAEEMAEFFARVPEAIENSEKIAKRCEMELKLGETLLPVFPIDGGVSANQYLKNLVNEKLKSRYENPDEKIISRVNYELGVIEKTKFADYFLIVADFVNWAKDRSIAVGPGRGSAAGSIISYILGITDIDPLKYGLLFERFLNPERISMPDIDLDFADNRRDEVVEYVRQKYGEDRVAQIITFGTMAARAAIRDAGRALSMPYSFCDQIAKLIPFNIKLNDAVKKIKELKEIYEKDPEAKKLIEAAKHLEGVCRHASVHACGVVISKKPLDDYVPLQRAPQNPNIIITQFEMHSIEDLGLLKMDFLGLKNLTIIEETIRLIKEMRGEILNISKIPLDDKKTFELLQRAETISVFQLESEGMRRYLKELRPTEFEDIVAMVALYRPGPLETGMVPKYIARKHGKEKINYLHPKLEPILKNTYGIGVYQEQMMKIAQELAGFTLAEADILRKAIGKKIQKLLDAQKEKLIEGMKKNGINEKTANAVWELFPSFAKYGFNKSHAACYAMIAYQTAYLKAHYPIEFMTSLFNADAGDVERIAYLIEEAKKYGGVAVFPPDINKSFVNFVPEENNIRFGLLAIKNVGANVVEAIIEERLKGGIFKDFADFLNRVSHKDLNKKSLESMIKAGVFDSFGEERGTLIGNIEKILAFSQNLRKSKSSAQNNLFGSDFVNHSFKFEKAAPATNKEKLAWEKELVGLYISEHPLKEHSVKIKELKITPITEIKSKKAGNFRLAGVITRIRKILTKTGQPMIFAQIEDLGDNLEIVIFPDTLAKNPSLWQENNVIAARGRLSFRNDEPKIICEGAVEL